VNINCECCGAENSVEVKEIVERVREQRPGMVQTEAQYKFLYDIIPHIVQAQKTVLIDITQYTHAALTTLTSSRQHLSHDVCLKDEREDYHNCSLLCCVLQLYTMLCTYVRAVAADN